MGICRFGRFTMEHDYRNDELILQVDGYQPYINVLQRTFPSLHFRQIHKDISNDYHWSLSVQGASKTDEKNLSAFCNLLRNSIYIQNDLDECFALDTHKDFFTDEKTDIGCLVYEAKPYNREGHTGNKDKAKELAQKMADFIQKHPTYLRAELIVPIPPSNPNKNFDLPTSLSEEIAKLTSLNLTTTAIKKKKATRPMKDCRTLSEKIKNIRGAFEADESMLKSKTIILIDDIYDSGSSVNEVGRILKEAGTAQVLCLVATKTSMSV